MKLAIVLLLAASAFGQDLPDAPQPQPTPSVRLSYIDGTLYDATPKNPSRGPKKLWLLLAVSAFEQATNIYDTRETEKGLKAGVAIEGNTFWVGSHPSARALYARDLFQLGVVVTPALVAYALRSKPFYYAGLALPAVLAGKHIQAGRQWQALLDGQKPTGSELGP